MRVYVLLALAGWCGWLLVRVLGGRSGVKLLACVAAVTCLVGYFEATWWSRERTYSAVSTALVGREVKVHCQRTAGFLVDISGYMGFVPYPAGGGPANDAHLRNDTCRSLGDYVGDTGTRTSPDGDHVRAVHVLTHEAMHMAGLRVEAEAECAAMQRNAVTARALGATPEQAVELARVYYVEHYPRLRDNYISADCVDGGRLDEDLPDPPWPDVRVGGHPNRGGSSG